MPDVLGRGFFFELLDCDAMHEWPPGRLLEGGLAGVWFRGDFAFFSFLDDDGMSEETFSG